MHGFWLLLHILGYTLWLGGGIATMVAGSRRRASRPTSGSPPTA
jgi:hypothetical protein